MCARFSFCVRELVSTGRCSGVRFLQCLVVAAGSIRPRVTRANKSGLGGRMEMWKMCSFLAGIHMGSIHCVWAALRLGEGVEKLCTQVALGVFGNGNCYGELLGKWHAYWALMCSSACGAMCVIEEKLHMLHHISLLRHTPRHCFIC